MNAMIWVGPRPAIKTWPTKAAAITEGAVQPKQVQFTFEKVWVDAFNGVLMTDGRRAITHECWCGHEHLFGLRDMAALDSVYSIYPQRWEAWRESFDGTVEA